MDTNLYPLNLSWLHFQFLFVHLPPLWLLPSASAPRGNTALLNDPLGPTPDFYPRWQGIVSLGAAAPFLPFSLGRFLHLF